MVEPITASYVQEDDDWTITVAGLGKKLTARAPGIIAARDRTDQLVEKLVPDGKGTTVVHLLNGSALAFTSAYMTARLTRPEPAPADEPAAPTGTETPPKFEEPKAETEAPPAIKGSTRLEDVPKGKLADIAGALSNPKSKGEPVTVTKPAKPPVAKA
ncbi:hypothetical protein [Amycolatopsis anabasis]|uniref:hypothetical protein n=1 Tax=Amycolatopsis anabasis TaxID=1840409 RepID=UPI00131C4F28|nr:hypothetical protein [Amycolatopsis anabasis]